MKKLKHIVTTVLGGEEFYLICIDGFACLDSWNHFTDFIEAEKYLISNFAPEKGKLYSIVQVRKSKVVFYYK